MEGGKGGGGLAGLPVGDVSVLPGPVDVLVQLAEVQARVDDPLRREVAGLCGASESGFFFKGINGAFLRPHSHRKGLSRPPAGR